MKIMLIEDDRKKISAISSYLTAQGVPGDRIIYAENMTDFAANLGSDIGLFIIDFNIPNLELSSPQKNGRAILEAIIKAGKQDALLLAISSYPNDFPELREYYEANGCILADFTNTKAWQSTLAHLLIQVKKNLRFNFLIFCALSEERVPYAALNKGSQVIRGGIDCYDFKIGTKLGTAIVLPQMGLVNAAIVAGVCIEKFKPLVVGMSGICGGFSGRAEMGQLLISKMAYEYQSGKWTNDGFSQEPYQVPTESNLLTELGVLAASENLIYELEKDFNGTRPTKASKPDLVVFTSGSAVIASNKFINQISNIHRKVGGLDMEIFSIKRAAELSKFKPPCICAKTVVDLCNSEKNDDLHAYGSYVSAKFVIKAINNLLS